MMFIKVSKRYHKSEEFLDKFRNNEERADEYLKKFKDVHEANDFLQIFNSSFDCTSKFIKSLDNSKEALEHFKKTQQECDKRMDNFCGNNCKWIFDEKTKTLFIRENGKMNDYKINWDYKVSTAHWAIRKQIENAVISKGITTIGEKAFYNCSLAFIIIPNCHNN